MQLATEKQLLEFYGSKVELRMEIWVEIIFEGAFLSQIHLLYDLDYKPLLNTGHKDRIFSTKLIENKKWVKKIYKLRFDMACLR